MDRLLNAMRRHAADMDGGLGQPRFAVITSFDPNTHTAKVQLQPEGTLTGWLPILAQGIGSGWGVIVSPAIGDQVFVVPQEGHAEHGVIVGRAFSDQQQPPATPSGEVWIVHSSGSFLKLTNDGNISVTAPTITMTGDLHVTGAVIAGYGGGDQVGLQTHRHTQPADTHGDTEQPTNAPTAGT